MSRSIHTKTYSIRLTGDTGTVLAQELKRILTVMFYPSDALDSETLTSAHLKRITGNFAFCFRDYSTRVSYNCDDIAVPEFLVSELQAAHVLRYQEHRPEVPEPPGETCKEQRVCRTNADLRPRPQDDAKEMTTELANLFGVLDLSPSAQLSDVCSQVTPPCLHLHPTQTPSSRRHSRTLVEPAHRSTVNYPNFQDKMFTYCLIEITYPTSVPGP